MKTFLVMLLVSMPAFATTKVKLPNGQQPVQNFCEIRAKQLSAKAVRVAGGRGRAERTTDLVFWQLEILDVSSKDGCPPEKNIDLRIRAADFSGTPASPNIVYTAGVTEPASEEVFKAKIRFIEGRDTYTNRKYHEWTFVERSDD
jgi:hypothetical protein